MMLSPDPHWYACANSYSSVAHLAQNDAALNMRAWCGVSLDPKTGEKDGWRRCKNCQKALARFVAEANAVPPETTTMQFVIRVTRPTEDWQTERFPDMVNRKFRSSKRTTIEFIETSREAQQ